MYFIRETKKYMYMDKIIFAFNQFRISTPLEILQNIHHSQPQNMYKNKTLKTLAD